MILTDEEIEVLKQVLGKLLAPPVKAGLTIREQRELRKKVQEDVQKTVKD